MKIIIILPFLIFISSCALFSNRTFITEMEKDTDGFWIAGRDFRVVGGDSGNPYRTNREILERTPASYKESERMMTQRSIEKELFKKERALRGNELSRYNEHIENFESSSEKIYYLDLSPDERMEYLGYRGIENRAEGYIRGRRKNQRSVGSAFIRRRNVENQNVWIGMDESDVVRIWGRPVRVEVAGHPKFRNERWVFHENGRSKFVYIEMGKVQGWAID